MIYVASTTLHCPPSEVLDMTWTNITMLLSCAPSYDTERLKDKNDHSVVINMDDPRNRALADQLV